MHQFEVLSLSLSLYCTVLYMYMQVMMIWYVIVFTLFADLGTLKADDTVHRSIYSPLLLAEKTNILFATTPLSSIMAKGGNILFACLILPRLLARKSPYYCPFIKSATMVITVILLLQCGDIERNPGPFHGKSYMYIVHLQSISLTLAYATAIRIRP